MKTVYLCGAINGCTDAECKDWRELAKRGLPSFRILDPMRRDYRGREDDCASEIVLGDYADIRAADIVLAVADKPSWGTAMEIHEANWRGKYVVVVCSQEQVSPWLRCHANAIFKTLAEALEYLESIKA